MKEMALFLGYGGQMEMNKKIFISLCALILLLAGMKLVITSLYKGSLVADGSFFYMQSPSELGIVNINTLSNPQILDFSKVFAKHKLKSKILPKTICNEFEFGDKELAMLCRGQGDTLVIVYANECSAKLFKISKKNNSEISAFKISPCGIWLGIGNELITIDKESNSIRHVVNDYSPDSNNYNLLICEGKIFYINTKGDMVCREKNGKDVSAQFQLNTKPKRYRLNGWAAIGEIAFLEDLKQKETYALDIKNKQRKKVFSHRILNRGTSKNTSYIEVLPNQIGHPTFFDFGSFGDELFRNVSVHEYGFYLYQALNNTVKEIPDGMHYLGLSSYSLSQEELLSIQKNLDSL